MDSVHEPDSRDYISPIISVRAFADSWSDVVATQIKPKPKQEREYLAEKMDVEGVVVDELQSVCSVDNLTCDDEPSTFIPEKGQERIQYVLPPEDYDLITLKIQRKVLQVRHSRATPPTYDTAVHRFKYFEPKLLKVDSSVKIPKENCVQPRDAMLQVTSFAPYKREAPHLTTNSGLKVEQEMLLLSSQYLTELRDHISCVSDVGVPGEFSENPDMPQDERAKDLYPSGFFYINGVFYNDTRHPLAKDNSAIITDWAAANPELEIGPFESKSMASVTFLDLELRLGYPYLYQHQGCCEHLIVFSDLRMVSPSDCQDRTKYPLIRGIPRKRRVACMTCHVMTARWVTRGNKRLPQDPFFFCDTCFRSFNYTPDGQKIGQFRAHPFFDRSALM